MGSIWHICLRPIARHTLPFRLVNFRFSYAVRAGLNDNLVLVRVDANPICVWRCDVNAYQNFFYLISPLPSQQSWTILLYRCSVCVCCCDFKYDANHHRSKKTIEFLFSIDFPFTRAPFEASSYSPSRSTIYSRTYEVDSACCIILIFSMESSSAIIRTIS